jgi:hypothetical protein
MSVELDLIVRRDLTTRLVSLPARCPARLLQRDMPRRRQSPDPPRRTRDRRPASGSALRYRLARAEKRHARKMLPEMLSPMSLRERSLVVVVLLISFATS